MAEFTTHIELIDGTADDYVALDAAMQRENFSRTVRSPHGFEYTLPRATYVSSAFNMTAGDVRDLAMKAAQTTGRRYDIVTTAGDVAYFLHPIDAPRRTAAGA